MRTTAPESGRANRLVLSVLCVVAAVLALDPTGALPLPPMHPGGWYTWAQDADPSMAALAIARAALLGWLVVQAVALAVRVVSVTAGCAGGVRATDVLAARCTRRAAEVLAAAILAIAGLALPAGAQGAGPTVTVTVLSEAPERETTPTSPVASPVRVQPSLAGAAAIPETAGLPTEPILTYPSTSPPEGVLGPSVPTPATWTIRPGEHLWSVAEQVVRAARPDITGRAGISGDPEVSDDDVARYLRRLVETNAERLVVPGEPDLVLPGQVFELPAP